jgi:transcriptional regulator GlxA family with amidase domain
LAGAREHGIDPSDSRLIMSGRPSSQRAPHVPTEPPADHPRQVDPIGFLPLPQFPIYALILALESLRIANQNAGRRLFSGHLFGVDGAPVPAGNGMTMTPERAIAEVSFCPTVIVCAGKRADRAHHPRPARRLSGVRYTGRRSRRSASTTQRSGSTSSSTPSSATA